MRIRSRSLVFSVFASLTLAAGCGGGGNNPPPDDTVTQQEVINNYGDIVLASYQDSLASVQNLREKLDAFVADPNADTFEDAKNAWLASREFYGQTEAYRFYNGPIDDADGPEGLINAWPLDEGYIDYVDGEPDNSIISNTVDFPNLTPAVIAEQNELISDTSISTGFHAIEFLLWGQDLSDGPEAGQRPFTDFVTDGSGTATNQERRGQYLKAIAELLETNLQSVTDEWAPGQAGNYRAFFESLPPSEALSRILIGAGSLSGGELGGERMSVALSTHDKEDEHSCFSNNTHRDFLANEKGIQNVYLGRYVKANGTVIDGPGIEDLVEALDANLHQEVADQFTTVNQALNDINANAPFDQMIAAGNTTGNARVSTAVQSLQDQTALISEIGAALGLNLNLDLDGE